MDRMYYQSVTIPPNTPLATPVSQSWVLEEAHLKYIEIVIPDGPSGFAGFRILWAQQQIFPWSNLSYLTPNNEKIHMDMDVDITITGLVIEAYNTDVWPHTFYFRGVITDLSPTQAANLAAVTGSVSVPGSQVDTDDTSGIDTMTAPFDDTDDSDTEEGDTGSDDTFDSDSFDDTDSGMSDTEIDDTGTADLPAPVAVSTLPATITLIGTPVKVSEPKAPSVTVKKKVVKKPPIKKKPVHK
jgi:hypothetical protein